MYVNKILVYSILLICLLEYEYFTLLLFYNNLYKDNVVKIFYKNPVDFLLINSHLIVIDEDISKDEDFYFSQASALHVYK